MPSPEQEPIYDLPQLADELLEEIFLRIASPADLARASAACVTFRRLVTGRSFLRRYRSLHKPPPLLGLLGHDGFHPAEPPHPSAAAARALAHAADFSFSFLPSPGRWIQQDCLDGRVLLERSLSDNDDAGEGELVPIDTRNMADLAVCDPVSRRYVILPPIPDDLITSGEQEGLLVFETFLAPAAAEEEEEMVDTTTSFRVVARANYESKVVIFVFSSLTEEWHSSKSVSWSLLTADSWFSATAQAFIWFFPRYYAHGCIYWVMYLVDKLLVLDICKMVLSTINFQWDQDSPIPDILEMDDDMIGAFCLKGDLSGRTHLCYGAK